MHFRPGASRFDGLSESALFGRMVAIATVFDRGSHKWSSIMDLKTGYLTQAALIVWIHSGCQAASSRRRAPGGGFNTVSSDEDALKTKVELACSSTKVAKISLFRVLFCFRLLALIIRHNCSLKNELKQFGVRSARVRRYRVRRTVRDCDEHYKRRE